MQEITPSGSLPPTIGEKTSQPRLIIQALIFTGILYLTAGLTLPNTKIGISKPSQTNAILLTSVQNAVLQDVSAHSGLPKSALRIVETQQHTWHNDCLGVNKFGVLCAKITVPGWQVTIVSERQRWIYRTNASGSVVKLAAVSISDSKTQLASDAN